MSAQLRYKAREFMHHVLVPTVKPAARPPMLPPPVQEPPLLPIASVMYYAPPCVPKGCAAYYCCRLAA